MVVAASVAVVVTAAASVATTIAAAHHTQDDPPICGFESSFLVDHPATLGVNLERPFSEPHWQRYSSSSWQHPHPGASAIGLWVCGAMCPSRQGSAAHPLLDSPFDVRVALVPRAYVAPHYPARYITQALCALEADGWLLLDMDAVVVSEDPGRDLAAALGGYTTSRRGGLPPVQLELDLARVALALFYPRPHHFQLWSSLDAFPGALAVFAEDLYRSTVTFAPLLGWVTCAAAAVAQVVFVRGGGVPEALLPNCEWLLEGTGGVGEGAKAALATHVDALLGGGRHASDRAATMTPSSEDSAELFPSGQSPAAAGAGDPEGLGTPHPRMNSTYSS